MTDRAATKPYRGYNGEALFMEHEYDNPTALQTVIAWCWRNKPDLIVSALAEAYNLAKPTGENLQ
jgi:hypothetical protein